MSSKHTSNMKKKILLYISMLGPVLACAQVFTLRVEPVWEGRRIVLETPWPAAEGDTVRIDALKFYLGRFCWLQKGRVVYTDSSYHLIDLEADPDPVLTFRTPKNLHFDQLRFQLGIDSATNVGGVMGGDLDPTRGMYWTWQSGYINIKIEGAIGRSAARGDAFEWHLGGYRAPHATAQTLTLYCRTGAGARLTLDLAPLFRQADWQKEHHLMLPGAVAARFSAVLARSFHVYAP